MTGTFRFIIFVGSKKKLWVGHSENKNLFRYCYNGGLSGSNPLFYLFYFVNSRSISIINSADEGD